MHTVPEHGVTVYAGDPTQGPACALACAAGSVYRNYFCPRELLFDSRCLAPVEINEADDMYPGQSHTLQVSNGMAWHEQRRASCCVTVTLPMQVNNLAGIHSALSNSTTG
jgi:hypothetical protein